MLFAAPDAHEQLGLIPFRGLQFAAHHTEAKAMQIPLEWLQEYVNVDDAVDVGTRLTMGGLEVEGIETVKEADRPLVPVLDVYVTPNRGDCLSMLGVAREVAALYGVPLRQPEIRAANVAEHPSLVRIEAPDLCPRYAARIVRNVKVGPSPAWMQARLLSAGMRPINNIVDVTNYVMLELGQPLHAFDLDRLDGKRIVVRCALPGELIVTLDGIERALGAEMLVIADATKAVAVAGVMGGAASEVTEASTNLLIESAHFNPLSVRRTSRALALRTEASYRFERVVDPGGVQRAANRACQLLSDMRCGEAEPDIVDVYPIPDRPRTVMLRQNRAAELLGMDITRDIATDCLTRLGFRIAGDRTAEALTRGATPRQRDARPESASALLFEVPSFRADIRLEEDLIEEIGRVHGYENIPERLPVCALDAGGDSVEGRLITHIRTILVSAGLQEVVTHSLTAPSFFEAPDDAARCVSVRNALSSEVSQLRRTLIPTLLEVAQHNAAHGQKDLALFEVGRVWRREVGATEAVEHISVAGLLVGTLAPGDWHNSGKAPVADYASVRGVIERLFEGLQIPRSVFLNPDGGGAPASSVGGEQVILTSAQIPQFHPGRTAFIRLCDGESADGVVGELHPELAAELSLRDRIYVFEVALGALQAAMPTAEARYRPLGRFPSVSRDLAPRVRDNVSYLDIQRSIESLDLPLLEGFRITDLYVGPPLPEGVKSLTLAFTFRSEEGTLSDMDVSEAMQCIRTTLEIDCNAEFAA